MSKGISLKNLTDDVHFRSAGLADFLADLGALVRCAFDGTRRPGRRNRT